MSASPPIESSAGDDVAQNDAAEMRRHGVWAVAGRLLNAVTIFSLTFVLARVLGERDFARFNVLRTVLTLAGLAAASGLGAAALRATSEAIGRDEPARARRAVSQAGWFAVPVQVLVSLAVGVFVWQFGGRFFGEDAGLWLAACVAVATLAMAALQLTADSLRGLGDPAAANLLGGLRGAPLLNAGLLIGVLGLWAAGGATFRGAAFCYAAAGVVLIAPALLRLTRRVKTLPAAASDDAAAERSALWDVAWPVALATLLAFASTQCDQLIAPALMSEGESADYVNARRVVLLAMFPLSVLNTTAAGLIGRMYFGGRRERLGTMLQAGATLIALPCLVFYAVTFVAPEFVVRVVLGEGYAGVADPLRWLVPGHVVLTMTGACGLLLTLTGWQRWALALNAVSLVVLLAAGPTACRMYGPVGLAVLVSSIVGLQNAISWGIALRKAGVNTRARLTLLLQPRKFRASLRPRADRTTEPDELNS